MVSTAHEPNGTSVGKGVQRNSKNAVADEHRVVTIRSNTLEARLKLRSGMLSLFDAVAFFASP